MNARLMKTAGLMTVGLTLVAGTALVNPRIEAGAQVAPGPPDRQVETATMTREQTEVVLNAYLAQLVSNGSYADFFADDIILTLMDAGDVVEGRQAVTDTVRFLHEMAFDAAPEVESIIYGEGIASAEIVFAAKHMEEFNGIPATGAEIRVPYSVVWELEHGKIVDLRVYQLASGLTTHLLALTAEPES